MKQLARFESVQRVKRSAQTVQLLETTSPTGPMLESFALVSGIVILQTQHLELAAGTEDETMPLGVPALMRVPDVLPANVDVIELREQDGFDRRSFSRFTGYTERAVASAK